MSRRPCWWSRTTHFSPPGNKHHVHVNFSKFYYIDHQHSYLVTWLQTKSTFTHQWTTGYPPVLLNTHWASGERLCGISHQPRSQGSLLPVPTERERTWERGWISHLPCSSLSIALQHYVGQLSLLLTSFSFQARAYSLLHSVCLFLGRVSWLHVWCSSSLYLGNRNLSRWSKLYYDGENRSALSDLDYNWKLWSIPGLKNTLNSSLYFGQAVHHLFAKCHFLLVSVNDFVREWLIWNPGTGQVSLKSYFASKKICLWLPDGPFFKLFY